MNPAIYPGCSVMMAERIGERSSVTDAGGVLPDAIPQERSRLHFSMPLSEQAWIAGLSRACTVIENDPALPQEPLVFAFKKEQLEFTADRTAFLRSLLASAGRYLVLTNGRRLRFERSGAIDEGQVSICGVLQDTARKAYDLTVEFPTLSWEIRENLLAALGDALGAYTGHITPARAAQAFASHYLTDTDAADSGSLARTGWERDARSLRECMERRSVVIPRIQHISIGGGRASPLQPAALGWINYWSADTCSYLGFPALGRDGDLLKLAYQTPQGAWMVKLCEAPLDVSMESHVETVASVYRRFPELGIRAASEPAGSTTNPVMIEPLATQREIDARLGESEFIEPEFIEPEFVAPGPGHETEFEFEFESEAEFELADAESASESEPTESTGTTQGATAARAYVATSNQEAVAEAVRRVLAAVPGTRIGMQGLDTSQVVRARHADSTKPRWTVTITPGAKGWTLLDAQPAELLAEPGSKGVPLLAEICSFARARGFLFVVRSAAEAVLLEADAWGEHLLSGRLSAELPQDAATFHGHPLPEDRTEVRFEIVPVQPDLLGMDGYLQLADYFKRELGGARAP